MQHDPVEDMDILPGTTVSGLIEMFGRSGGFTARKLADAAAILDEMMDGDVFRFLSFPGCIVATGARGAIRTLVREHMVDTLITTCGTIDHDIARSYRDYYRGDFLMDDTDLRRRGVNRLGNILVPDGSYGEIIEARVPPMLEDIARSTGDRALSTRELLSGVGERLPEDSILHCCWKNGVPVYVPGITDGAFGTQVWMFMQTHGKGFRVDVFRDEDELAGRIFPMRGGRTGALIVGGGISKHHTIWWNQFKGGLDYAVYLTTAEEYDGSLSGARMREAVSWGKVHERGKFITVEGDATLTLPVLVAYLVDRKSEGGAPDVQNDGDPGRSG